jgi:diaminopimelate decarboxylase
MEALAAGVPADRIVLDGPAKTWGELELALQLGVSLNIDNFQELARVDQLIAGRTPAGQIGIRINPQVGPGSITGMSTATASSKFGVPLDDPGNRAALIAAYQARPWLTAIHTHVGSQGVPMDLAAGGIARALDLVSDINRTSGTQQITTVNIGGGLSVNFQDDEVRPTFAGYARALAAKVPDLFTGRYKVVTEFGRSLLAKHGFMISRVEYTKAVGGSRIAITHAGAQVAVRTVFRPDEWPIRISALTPRGTAKTGTLVPQDIAGPCCFAGDLLAKGRLLPLLEQNDLILAHDTGAYYFSNPFSYNSLPAPPAYLVSDGSSLDFEEIRRTTLPQVAAS